MVPTFRRQEPCASVLSKKMEWRRAGASAFEELPAVPERCSERELTKPR